MHQMTDSSLNDAAEAIEREGHEEQGVLRLLSELGKSALFVPYSRARCR